MSAKGTAASGAAGKTTVEVVHEDKLSKEKTVLVDERGETPVRRLDVDEPAKVWVSAGITINLGNFESVRIDAGITLPCRPEDRDKAFAEAADWVQAKIGEQKKAIVSVKNGEKGI